MRPRANGGDSATLAQVVSDELRQLIVTGEIPPGQRILAKDVAQRFGVSHIPVREAMRQLDGEGLLHYHSQRGATASEISLDELAEIYEVRRFLETRAAVASAGRYDAAHLDRLHHSLERLEHSRAEDPHSAEFMEAHHEFHWLLLAPGCSTLVERILRQLWRAADRYVHLGLGATGATGPGRHHRKLYMAARAGDASALGALMEEHLHITEESVVARLRGVIDGAAVPH